MSGCGSCASASATSAPGSFAMATTPLFTALRNAVRRRSPGVAVPVVLTNSNRSPGRRRSERYWIQSA
jgi:hypothetical protein